MRVSKADGSQTTDLTVTGNLTADPELRFTPGGSAVANFTIASTPRTFDARSNAWVDGETLFLRPSVCRGAAEHVAESLANGMRVIVTGVLKSRSYETKAGEKRTVIELDVEEIGPSLRYATSAVTRTGAGPSQEPARHPADSFTISAREYADDDPWFGLDANPEGRINATTQGVSGA
jgi:single-strand DNA-binding protein